MKKITLLFTFFVLSATAQQSQIVLRLVDPNVGQGFFTDLYNPGNTSNDAGLNAIFQNFSVQTYQVVDGHPYQPYLQREAFVNFTGNSADFLQQLQAYSSVIEAAYITSDFIFKDALQLSFGQNPVALPAGFENGNVVTTDPYINQLFQQHNVFYYANAFPSSQTVDYIYDLTCNCDATALKQQLLDYTTVVGDAYFPTAVFLKTKAFNKNTAVIYPNPVVDNLNVSNIPNAKTLSIYDVTGKRIIEKSGSKLENVDVSGLNSGLYLLQIMDVDGNRFVKKFVKK